MDEVEQTYVDTPTLAKMAGVPRETIGMDIRRGILPAERRADSRGTRWGGCWFIRANDAQKYIDTRKVAPPGISAREFGKRTGQDHHDILDAIHKGLLPAARDEYRKRPSWHISEEDAKVYSHRMGWKYIDNIEGQSNRHEQAVIPESEELPIDIHDQCDCCGNTRGNIFGDIDKTTHERYGYLCTKCHQLVSEYQRNPMRLRNVFEYIEKTRGSRV